MISFHNNHFAAHLQIQNVVGQKRAATHKETVVETRSNLIVVTKGQSVVGLHYAVRTAVVEPLLVPTVAERRLLIKRFHY